MKRSTIVTMCLASFVLTASAAAQEVPKSPKPTDEHKWLKQFEGEWELKSKGISGEGQPAIESTGTMTSKMLGGFWVTNTMEAKMAGMQFTGLQTIGYDVKKKKYIGTWVDTTNHHMWKYIGSVGKSGKKLTLHADGPDMTDPTKTQKYRDAYEFKSKDEIVLTSSMKTADGKWVTFMTGTAKRKK